MLTKKSTTLNRVNLIHVVVNLLLKEDLPETGNECTIRVNFFKIQNNSNMVP